MLPASCADAVLGDLIEEYAIRARAASPRRARVWFWVQVWRSIPPLLRVGIKRDAWLTNVVIALGIYIGAGMIEFAGVAVVARVLGPDAGALPALSAVVGIGTIGLGGHVAARIRRGAAAVLAAIVVLAVATLMITVPDSAPLWYAITFLIAGPVAALAGGRLASRDGSGGLVAPRGGKHA